MNTDDIRSMQAIDGQIDTLEASIADLKKRREKVHETIINSFEREGVQNIRVDGRTFYLRRDVWARAKRGQNDRLLEVLRRDDDTAPLVKSSASASSLAAYVRERIAEHDDDPTLSTMPAKKRAALVLPPALLAVLEVDETYSIRSQKVPTTAKSKS